MRSNASEFDLSAAASLRSALQQLAEAPGQVTPFAGGTELMVAFNTGRLTATKLLSIRHLPELRFITTSPTTIEIGAASTFTDIRQSELLRKELPLLEQAASWTGSIANQNRATVGGNICNASPAADTPPVLLAYDAELKLISTRGTRSIAYREFHLGYKRTALLQDELLFSIMVRPGYSEWRQYLRKVGTRKAQAISKVALAGVASVQDNKIAAVRLGAASLADRPLRLQRAEEVLTGASVAPASLEETVRAARQALAMQAQPIDDIRSTARYRVAVAANLLEEFLRSLAP